MAHKHQYTATGTIVMAEFEGKANVCDPRPLRTDGMLGYCVYPRCKAKAIKSPYTGIWTELKEVA